MRCATITSISLPGTGQQEGRLSKVLKQASDWIDHAAREDPDLVILPESLNGLGLGSKDWARSAEEVPGPTSMIASTKAAEYSTYILCPIVRKDHEGLHNSALLYDRSGDLVSIYDKVHPTITELEEGVIPGVMGRVYSTDFGKLGFAICFDLNFRDLREYYKRRPVQLVCFPSMFRGGIQLRLWAFELGCYVVSATPGEQSAIVNPLGRIVAESYQYNRIITAKVNMDYEVLHLDYNSEKFESMKAKYGTDVQLEVASPEGIFTLSSFADEVTAAQIVREFGLETRSEYFKRSEKMRRELLAQKQPATPSRARSRHG